MRILFASDIHAAPNLLADVTRQAVQDRAEALIIGGDIVPHDLPQARSIGILNAQADYIDHYLIPTLEQLKTRRRIRIFLDFGNDDLAANHHRLAQHQQQLLSLLHMRKTPLTQRVDIVGYMMVPPTPFQRKDWERPDAVGAPYPPGSRIQTRGYITGSGKIEETWLNLDSDQTIESDLAQLSRRIDRHFIFVSHCPPLNTPLDVIASGAHVGSLSIRRFIEQWSAKGLLLASLHGHVHESPKRTGEMATHINTTLCINPGQSEQLQFALLELTVGADPPRVELLYPQRDKTSGPINPVWKD
jgi:Icc-related predicted phosphoesterase